MADERESQDWQGGKPPGGVGPYSYKGRQVGWLFRIEKDAAEAKKLPRVVPRSKTFSFKVFGEGAKAAAKAHQRQIAEDHGLEIKNQYRHRTDPRDGLPYIEFHIRDTAGEDYYPKCDATDADLRLLGEHTWCVLKVENNIYVQTNVKLDGKWTMKRFHSFKCPDWPIVDHHSQIQKENRNGLDNRSKHLRDGSGGANNDNRRLQKNNTSRVNGVCYHKKDKCWYVRDRATTRARFPPKRFPGPEDKTHPSYHEACAYQREQAARVGNTNGQMPEDSDSDTEDEAIAANLAALGWL